MERAAAWSVGGIDSSTICGGDDFLAQLDESYEQLRWTTQVRLIRCAAAATVRRHELVDHAPTKPGRGEGKRPRRRDPWRAGAVADGRRDSDGRVEEQQPLLCSIVRSSEQ